MQKMEKNHRPEAEIKESKVAKSGKMMGIQDRHLRMRHPLIRMHARVKLLANTDLPHAILKAAHVSQVSS